MRIAFAAMLLLFLAEYSAAHPGKTDRFGGHKCWRDCAEWKLMPGEYHFHDEDFLPVKDGGLRVRKVKEPVGRRKAEIRPTPTPDAEPELVKEGPAVESPPARPQEAILFPSIAGEGVSRVDPGPVSWAVLILAILLRERKKRI